MEQKRVGGACGCDASFIGKIFACVRNQKWSLAAAPRKKRGGKQSTTREGGAHNIAVVISFENNAATCWNFLSPS